MIAVGYSYGMVKEVLCMICGGILQEMRTCFLLRDMILKLISKGCLPLGPYSPT
jgi:hypothetical protein